MIFLSFSTLTLLGQGFLRSYKSLEGGKNCTQPKLKIGLSYQYEIWHRQSPSPMEQNGKKKFSGGHVSRDDVTSKFWPKTASRPPPKNRPLEITWFWENKLCSLVLYLNTNYCAKFQLIWTTWSISMAVWKSENSDRRWERGHCGCGRKNFWLNFFLFWCQIDF